MHFIDDTIECPAAVVLTSLRARWNLRVLAGEVVVQKQIVHVFDDCCKMT